MNDSNLSEKSITDALTKELINRSIDLGIDYSEIGLDEIITDETLKAIPIIKSLYSIGKIGMAYKERHTIKKILMFFKTFHQGLIKNKEFEDFENNMGNDEKFRKKVTTHILILIERFLTEEKSEILARLLLAHINGSYDWEHFVDLTICLDSMHRKAYEYLRWLASLETPFVTNLNNNQEEGFLIACGIANRYGNKYSVTPLGQDLYKYGIKPMFNQDKEEK